jgi:hypothetical protein
MKVGWMHRLEQVRKALRWTRASYALLSGFLLTLFLLGYVWWPLAEEYLAYIDWDGPWWRTLDWLLLGIFFVMSLLIMAGADLRSDWKIILIGLAGGLAIESWGTQTLLWSYYTLERPPLWIIPAWPIASLSIDRMVRLLQLALPQVKEQYERLFYWLVFSGFFILMLVFVAPTLDKSLTIASLCLVTTLTVTPTDHRLAVLTFLAGSGLGYFLERWGTTRLCWTYYTLETPPFFAVLAHGMAAVAFWRVMLVLDRGLTWLCVPRRCASTQATPGD